MYDSIGVSITGFLLIGSVAYLSSYDGTASKAKSASDHEVVAKDAAWCWFSDPRAAYTSPVMLADESNRIYLFGRAVPQMAKTKDQYFNYGNSCYTYTDDLGKTRKKSSMYLRNTNRNNPIYLKVFF